MAGYRLKCSVVEYWHATVAKERLTPQATAAFLLASIVALEGCDDEFLGAEEGWRSRGGYFARVTFSSPAAGGELSLGWPLFDSRLVLDTLLFAQGWHRLAEAGELREPHKTKDVDELARRFLGVATLIAENRANLQPNPAGDPRGTASPLLRVDSWDQLMRRLRAVADAQRGDPSQDMRDGRSFYLRRWIIERIGLMATPETGLAPADAGALIGALEKHFGKQWGGEMIPPTRDARRRRLQHQLDKTRGAPDSKRPTAEQLLVQIDDDAAKARHPWAAIERRFRGTVPKTTPRRRMRLPKE